MSLIACKKEGTPTIDNIKPNLTFEINGIRKFNSDTDYTTLGILYLNPSVIYDFNTFITDTGKVKKLEVSIDTFLRTSSFLSTSIVSIPDHTSSYEEVLGMAHNVYTITGIESYPLSQFTLSGKMTPHINNQVDRTAYILCKGDDYNPSNTTHINIKCIITYQPPDGYGWKRF